MAEKLFYTMGEVSELFDVNPSLLRYWEEQFPKLRPKRNKKGNRLYSPQDVALLKTIYHLVKERGMKIEGARRALREEHRPGSVARNAELTERLQRIRALLMEVREELKANADELVGEPEPERLSAAPSPDPEAAPDAAANIPAASEPAVPEPVASAFAAPEPVAAAPAVPEPAVPAPAASESAADAPATLESVALVSAADAPAASEPAAPASAAEQPAADPAVPIAGGKRRRRKKEEVENKELFAFYEQSLF